MTDADIQGAHDFMEEDEDGNRSIVCDIANRQLARALYAVVDWLENRWLEEAILSPPFYAGGFGKAERELSAMLQAAGIERPQ